MCSEQQLERSERRQNLVSLDHLVTYTLVMNVLLLLYSCVVVSFRRIRVCSEQQLERSERRQNLVSLNHLATYTLVRNV